MAYEVTLERKAIKKIRSLDKVARQRILTTVEALADDPRPHGAKALQGHLKGAYRMRISAPGGEYRIVWQIDDQTRTVTVIDAGPRESAY